MSPAYNEMVNGIARMATKRIQTAGDFPLVRKDLATVMREFPEIFEVLHEYHKDVADDYAEHGAGSDLLWGLLHRKGRELILADVRSAQDELETA